MVSIDLLVQSNGLFQTSFPDGRSFCWRLLTLKEYRVFRGLLESGSYEPLELHLMAFRRCYIGDSKLMSKKLPVGMLISIGQMIMWLSGDCERTTLRDDVLMSRQFYPAGNVQEHMKRVIWTAFPSYTIEEVDNWTRPELFRKFAVAEAVMLNRHEGYQMLNVDDIQFDDEPGTEQSTADIQQINFEQENKDVLEGTNFWDREEALTYEADERKKQLSKKQARALDSRR
jgi:hypothetical protein